MPQSPIMNVRAPERTVNLRVVFIIDREKNHAEIKIFGVDDASRRWIEGANKLGVLDDHMRQMHAAISGRPLMQDGPCVPRESVVERNLYAPAHAVTPRVFAFMLEGRLARALPEFHFDVGPR